MSQTNPITKSSVDAIMNKRKLIPSTAKRIAVLIDSDGNDVDVVTSEGEVVMSKRKGEEGMILRRRIFNVRANSDIAMNNPRNREYFKNGCRAEFSGGNWTGIIGNEKEPKAHTADEWFSAYLNATQMSFGVLLPNRLVDNGSLTRGAEIVANVEVIKTDNGTLVTLDSSTIAVSAPEVYGKTTFSSADMDLTEEEIELMQAENTKDAKKSQGTKAGSAKSALAGKK